MWSLKEKFTDWGDFYEVHMILNSDKSFPLREKVKKKFCASEGSKRKF
jgi:hypothetical protein